MNVTDWQTREDEKNGETTTDILCGTLAGVCFGMALMVWIVLGFSLDALFPAVFK